MSRPTPRLRALSCGQRSSKSMRSSRPSRVSWPPRGRRAATREVELLLDKSVRLVDVSAKLHEQKAKQLALQVEAARKALPLSDGAPSCKHAAAQ